MIQAWATLVGPYTPTFSLDLSPQDPLLDNISILLSIMAFYAEERTYGHLHSKILPLWPIFWVWLQILHNDKMRSSSLQCVAPVGPEIRQNRHQSIFRVVVWFLNIKPPAGLSAAMTHAEDVMDMSALMWIEESKDTPIAYATSGFLVDHNNGAYAPMLSLRTFLTPSLFAVAAWKMLSSYFFTG